MITQAVTVTEKVTQNIIIGRRGTHGTEQIVFDISYLIENYGAGTAALLVKRSQDETAYPASISQSGNSVTWVIEEVDTAFKGHGECELYWYVNGALAKTILYGVTVLRDIGDTPVDPPDPYETWIDYLTQLGTETFEAANAAAESAADAETAQGLAEDAQAGAETAEENAEASALKSEGFAVGEQNGTPVASGSPYYQNNAEYYAGQASNSATSAGNAQTAAETAQGKAEDAQEAAETAQGKAEDAQSAAEIAVTHYPKIENGYWYVWQNGGWVNTGVDARGIAGRGITKTEASKTSTSGLVDTYTVTVTYTDGNTDTFTFNVTNGEDGYNPVVTIATITGGHRITITDKDHPSGQHFDVMDGSDGITPTVTITPITGGHNVAFDYGSGDPRNTDFDVMDGEVSSSDLQAVADAKAPVIIDHAEGDIAAFVDGADGMPLKECVISIEPVQSGSGDPSPDNVRPISGWTGANVTRTGKNLLWLEDGTDTTMSRRTATALNNVLTVTATGRVASKHFLGGTSTIYGSSKPTFPSGTYTFTQKVISNSTEATILLTPHIGLADGTYEMKTVGVPFTVSQPFHMSDIDNSTSVTWANGMSVSFELCLAVGNDTTFESNVKSSLSIPFGSTVYGGSLDVNTGVLTVTYGFVDLGSLSWISETSTVAGLFRVTSGTWGSLELPLPKYLGNLICSQYKGVKVSGYSSVLNGEISVTNSAASPFLRVRDEGKTNLTAEQFQTAVNGVQLVYELATPLTYQLTTAQQLTTLLGLNNIWADTGDTSVDYCCDTKLFIEKLTAPTEDDLIADHAISSGTFFMTSGNNLYLATANIANGAQIIEGTNATKLSLADALNTINS